MKSGNIRKAAIFGNSFQDPHLEYVALLLNSLSDAGIDVMIEESFMSYLAANAISNPAWRSVLAPDAAGTGVVISLGGDGTFLRAAEWVADRRIPVLGVNSGHLGFLANYTPEEAPSLVADLLHGNLEVESRMLLKVDARNIPEGVWPYALNEVAFLKEDSSSMINVRTGIDNYYLTDYQADGLLISTPTGSTAYNLSAGGPILQPTLECWLLSPVAPHSLTMRPLAVSASSTVSTVTVSRSGFFRLSIDGRSFPLPSGSEVKVTRAPFPLLVMRRRSDDFASTLRKKLSWGQR